MDGQTDGQTEQTTDRQRYFFELTPIHKGNFDFLCVWEGENKWGESHTSLLAMQVCFAHLLCLQGDKNLLLFGF